MIDLAFSKELRAAEQAVLRAAILTKRVLASAQEISKADASPVTVADFAAQALMISILHGTFPDDGFVGEEDAAALRGDAALRGRVYELFSAASGEMGLDQRQDEEEMLDLIDLGGRGKGGREERFWVMDPVDGTAAFLRNEQYAVSLALMEDGTEVLGVLCCPNLKLKDGRVHEESVDHAGLGVMLSAVKGQGSTIRTLTAVPTSATAEVEGGYVLPLPEPQPLPQLTAPEHHRDIHIVDNVESASRSTHPFISQHLTQRLGASYPGTDVWSSHVRYASLIIGGGHALLRVPDKRTSKSYIWDHAGSQLMYREVGGKVTDLEGKVMDFGRGRSLDDNYGLVAATEVIHDHILRLSRELLQERDG